MTIKPVLSDRRALILTLGALCALGAASIDMYLPALPSLAEELPGPAGGAQFTLSAFFLGMAFSQLVYGPLSDAMGRRTVLLGGLLVFVLASLACAMAESIPQLIGLRVLQALGAGVGGVVARAIVRDLYSGNQAASAQSLINLTMLVTPLLAPIIGGQLLTRFHWQSIFLVLALFGVTCIALTFFKVNESLPPQKRSTIHLATLLGGYARVLGNQYSLGCILTGAFAFGAFFAYLAGSPFVFIEIYAVPAERYGYFFSANIVGIMIAAFINSRVVLHAGPLLMLRIGVCVMALAAIVLLWSASTPGQLWHVVVPLFFVVGSIGIIGANAISCTLQLFSEIAGTAAATFGFIQMLIGALVGTAVGLLHDGSARPMCLVIAVMALTALSLCFSLIRAPRKGTE